MSKTLHLFGLVLLPVLVACSGAKKHPSGFVLDKEHVLTAVQHRSLDSLFRTHELSTGNEIALITHPTFNGKSAKDFAVGMGDSLGVGKKGRSNGVVIAYSKARREVFIATGKGTERVLHDSICQRIIDIRMIPRFRTDDHYGGLFNGASAVVEFLDRPEDRVD